jgi:hypothetical protein
VSRGKVLLLLSCRYGKQYVPITDAAREEELLFKVPKSLEVVGFTDRANVERW